MVREASPKKLQKERKLKEALEEYFERYVRSLEEGDRFISAIYLDEVVQTLLLESQVGLSSEGSLREVLSGFRSRIPRGRLEDYEDDVEIAIRKRFPEKYEKYLREAGKERDEN